MFIFPAKGLKHHNWTVMDAGCQGVPGVLNIL